MIWILAILFGIPALVGSHVKYFYVNKEKTFSVCYPFPDEWGPEYAKGVVLGKFLVFYACPLQIIAIFYALIAVHLIRSASNVPGETQGTARQVIFPIT
jgi:gastrin-releasing peptide receptor